MIGKASPLQKRNLLWLILSLVIIVADQFSKYLIMQHLSYAQPIAIFPFLNLTLAHNPGAAFSFLSGAGGWQRWLFIAIALVVSIFLIIWMMRLKSGEYLAACGISLVFGGAIGNLVDRIIHGYVIDFIQVYYKQWYFPDFNIADSAITIGAIFIILSLCYTHGE